MKRLACTAALACFCTLLAAPTGISAQHKPEKGLPCLGPDPSLGSAKFPGSQREIEVYDIDFAPKHDPKKDSAVCLSKEADAAMLWVSSKHKKFKVTFRALEGQQSGCAQHPFLKDPPPDRGDGYFSGWLRPDVPEQCVYDVVFDVEDGSHPDPHIQTTK